MAKNDGTSARMARVRPTSSAVVPSRASLLLAALDVVTILSRAIDVDGVTLRGASSLACIARIVARDCDIVADVIDANIRVVVVVVVAPARAIMTT